MTRATLFGQDGLYERTVDFAAHNGLHHGQVLEIVVCLKKGVASEEFDKDAADAPNITGEAPSKIENDLGCPIVTCRHNRRMILIIKRSGSKVYQPNLGCQQHFAVLGETLRCRCR